MHLTPFKTIPQITTQPGLKFGATRPDFDTLYPKALNVLGDNFEQAISISTILSLIITATDTTKMTRAFLEKFPDASTETEIQNYLRNAQDRTGLVPGNQPKADDPEFESLFANLMQDYAGQYADTVKRCGLLLLVAASSDAKALAADFVSRFPNSGVNAEFVEKTLQNAAKSVGL